MKEDLQNINKILLMRLEEYKRILESLKPTFNNDWIDKKRDSDIAFYKNSIADLKKQINKNNREIAKLKNAQIEEDKYKEYIIKNNIPLNRYNIDKDELEKVNKYIILSNSVKIKAGAGYILINDLNMLIDTMVDGVYNLNTEEFNTIFAGWDWMKIKNKYKLNYVKPYNERTAKFDFVEKYGRIYIKTPAILILNVVEDKEYGFNEIYDDFYKNITK